MLFATAFLTALSGALMPGPVLFAAVRWSAAHGRRVGPLIVLGHAVVELPLMLALIFGLGKTLRMDAFVGGIGLAGGAMLLAMSALMLRALPRLSLPQRQALLGDGAVPGTLKIAAVGLATSVSNPYFTLWWATIGLNFMAQAAPFGALGYAVFYSGHILADLAWYSAIAESMHRGRRLLSERGYRWLVGFCAILLVGFGVYFGYSGWGLLAQR